MVVSSIHLQEWGIAMDAKIDSLKNSTCYPYSGNMGWKTTTCIGSDPAGNLDPIRMKNE